MQNKPNFKDTQMNVSIVSQMAYENKHNWTLSENKPNQTQFKPIKANFKPNQTQSPRPQTSPPRLVVMANTVPQAAKAVGLKERQSPNWIHRLMTPDRAGWHRSKTLCIAENLTLLLLPAYSPELNPVELLWWQLSPLPELPTFSGAETLPPLITSKLQ